MFLQDSTFVMTIMAALLCVLVLLGVAGLIVMIKHLKRSNKLCLDNSYIIQKLPDWIKTSVLEALKPELDSMRRSIDNYAVIAGESQSEALQILLDNFVVELNKKVEESAAQYEMRIAQSSEHLNRSLAEINSSVSVTLTDALGGFDSELQATLTELLETMKRLRAVTNNIPKIIDNSFAEMQRSFDEMESEMQKTITAFRDMRVKIEAQQNALGPVQPGMVRQESVTPVPTTNEAATQKRRWLPNLAGNKNTANTPAPNPNPTVITTKPMEGIKSKPADGSGKMDFSNY